MNRINNFSVLNAFLLLLIFLGPACKKDTFSHQFEIDKEQVFKINENYFSFDSSIRVRVSAIQDSRCPSDVVCVWEGEAEILVIFEFIQPDSTILSTFDHRIDTLGNYSIELIEVKPYPISTDTIKKEEYNITLKITELITPEN